MFHAIPPSAEAELRRLLSEEVRSAPPKAMVAGLMNLGSGVAYRIVSDELEAIRESLAQALHGLLSAQDSQGWRPHVTIQNKVSSSEARALFTKLEAEFEPVPLTITGLGLHRYLGGPWEQLTIYKFRGV